MQGHMFGEFELTFRKKDIILEKGIFILYYKTYIDCKLISDFICKYFTLFLLNILHRIPLQSFIIALSTSPLASKSLAPRMSMTE